MCRPLVFAFAISAFFSSGSAFAQTPIEVPDVASLNLQNLTDDLSRADLFKIIIKEETKDFTEGQMEDFNLWGPFVFPNDTRFDVVQNEPRSNSIFGIDISHHNGSNVPLERAYQHNIKFVFMKATQGTGFRDGKFASFWSRLDSAPIERRVHRGAYHFLSATTDPRQQALSYLAVLKEQGGLKPTDLPPVVDLEWDKACPTCPDRWSGQDPDKIIEKTLTWLRVVEDVTKRKPLIYTARSWWREAIKSEEKFSRLNDYPIWIADYSKTNRAREVPAVPLNRPHALWQFTDSARFSSGYDRGVDANIFKGTEDSFYQTLNVARFQ